MPATRASSATLCFAFVLLVTTVACLLGRDSYLIGSAWWAVRWPVGLSAAVVLFSAMRSRRHMLAGLSAATLGLTLTDGASVALAHARPDRVERGGELVVVTHNLLFQGNVLSESVAGMQDAGPAVIALQEVTPGDARTLVSALESSLPFHHEAPHVGANGFALLSRFPLEDVRLVHFDGKLPFAQCATLVLPDGPLPLCNVHLSAPSKALRGFAAFPDLEGLESNAVRRSKEWSAVEIELDRRGGDRALALGDFNSHEAEPLYRSIRHDWVDAFRELHVAWGATWPNRVPDRRPFARIDYVFTRGALQPLDAQVISRSGSDHLGVSARLAR
ncbi:MAG: endonuclease/exonuclease/phosphatase family protein [Myxococcales bacterium]|nr:endonuclease/exonuclease/phosphatase family protein [Myxococcales bacterium]